MGDHSIPTRYDEFQGDDDALTACKVVNRKGMYCLPNAFPLSADYPTGSKGIFHG